MFSNEVEKLKSQGLAHSTSDVGHGAVIIMQVIDLKSAAQMAKHNSKAVKALIDKKNSTSAFSFEMPNATIQMQFKSGVENLVHYPSELQKFR